MRQKILRRFNDPVHSPSALRTTFLPNEDGSEDGEGNQQHGPERERAQQAGVRQVVLVSPSRILVSIVGVLVASFIAANGVDYHDSRNSG